MNTETKVLWWVVFVLTSLVLFCGMFIINIPSTGEKVGQIVRISREGIFAKTWEAELIRGGFSNGSGTVGVAPFYFTIDNPMLLDACQKALKEQAEVHIYYRTPGIAKRLTSGSDANFLTAIEVPHHDNHH